MRKIFSIGNLRKNKYASRLTFTFRRMALKCSDEHLRVDEHYVYELKSLCFTNFSNLTLYFMCIYLYILQMLWFLLPTCGPYLPKGRRPLIYMIKTLNSV